jgi:glycosyltransferase involved in cell wall biosynthesis
MLSDRGNPTVSVIMAARDAEPWLAASLKSILGQTLERFEFLIIDDASNDRTAEILEEFQQCDSRIKVYTNDSPKGLPVNLNFLIKEARGDYIARMDADDISHPERLEVQLAFMKKNEHIGLCFCEVNIILDEGDFLCRKWSPNSVKTALFMLPFLSYFVHPTAFVKREVYVEDGLYNENFLKGQDWELWKRILKKGIGFGIVPRVLFDYRLRLDSSSASLSSSSGHGLDYFKAIVLIRNRYKLKSIKLISKIPKKMLLRYIVNLFVPQAIFHFSVIINSKFNNNSAAKKLLRQHPTV